MNSRSVAIFAAVVAVLVGVSIYYLNSPWAPHYTDKVEPTPVPQSKPAVDPGSVAAATDTLPPLPKPKPTVKPAPAPVPAQPVEETEDDRRISQVLGAFPGDTDADHERTASLLINLLPSLGKDAQVECAQHITNLISDGTYLQKLGPIWRNAQFNPDVLEVIGSDLNNRENKVKMPAWLDAIKNPAHPYHEEAKNNMSIFLDGEDYENNIPKWERAMKQFLANEAKEEAEAEK